MTSKNQGRDAVDSPELIDISAFEDITSPNEQEPTQKELNDRRLAQAIDYLAKEGGDDSPATFMDRIDRIDNSLLLPLSQRGRNFDIKLFNRVLAMVSQAQLDFEEAAQGDSEEEDLLLMSNRESSMAKGVEELPEYFTPSAAEAVNRKCDGLDKPCSKLRRPMHAVRKPAAAEEQDVRRENRFRYGGRDNEAESWYKNYPASLPFPETFQLAHWESLKIDYDLLESIKQMKAEGKIVETNLPFDNPALEQFKTLPSFESGSRFKLPKASAIAETEIIRLGTQKNFAKVVEDLNRSNGKVQDGEFQYTPRVFLENLTVGTQADPTTIRHAVNTTPAKSRTGIRGSSTQLGSLDTTRKSPVARIPVKPTSRHPPSAVPQTYETDIDLTGEQGGFRDDNAHAKVDAAARVAHVADENLPKTTEHARSSTIHTNLVPPTSRVRTTSPVVRKISRERATSLERSPRRQSGVSTVPPSPDPPINKTSFHPEVVIENRPSGHHLTNSSVHTPSKSQPVPEPISVVAPKGTTRRPTKRKCGVSEQNYTPDTKRTKSIKYSAPKTPIQARARTTPDKIFQPLVEESDELDDFGENNVAEALSEISNSVVPIKSKPATKSKSTKTKTVPKKVTKKAAVAGKAVNNAQTKVVVEGIIHEEQHALPIAEDKKTKHEAKAGNTRSGLKYLKE
ncbi:hypothetical protein G6011_05594 [Alternaria panax]|uniref:Uncharacterized protein n=1 Tax=Alternaria panax TaxID=48097 RepID=A0AAD4I6M5_9PLEO|nr:hypothetical protein G6011_05594 [Alternaria panax]